MDENNQIGVIKVYYPVKGFGFITRESGKDVFFYRTDADKEDGLVQGSTVRFEVERTPKGPKAIKVVRVS